MKTIRNILWLIFVGIWGAFFHFLMGIGCCISIIFIPFGLKMFKCAKYFLSPFDKTIHTDFSKHPIANLFFLLTMGLRSAIGCYLFGALLCVTIVGIPFAKQIFKLAPFFIAPFGATISTRVDLF